MNSYLERLQKEINDATGNTESTDLTRGTAEKWNAAQILEHLFLTYKHTNRGLAKCMDGGAPLATTATFKHRLATFVVVSLGHMPGGRESPERAVPRGMPVDEVRQALVNELRQMDAKLDDCESRFGATAILDHPFLGPLTAEQWRKFHWVHGRHHARQIRERIAKS